MDEYEVNEARLTSILAGFGSLPAGSRHILIRELAALCEPSAVLDALIIAANHPDAGTAPNLDWISADGDSPAALARAATRHLSDEALATLVALLEDECDDGAIDIAAAWWSAHTVNVWQEVVQ